MRNVLFICARNRQRSPTAEQIFAACPNIEVSSAGLNPDADVPLTPELLEWADLIFVMEQMHRRKLQQKFSPFLHKQSIICLNIPDNYYFMAPELVRILHHKVSPFLPGPPAEITPA